MDRDQFDRITRHLTTGTSRRGAVGSALGGVTALLMGAGALEAKPGGNGKSNGNGQEKKAGKKSEKTTGTGKAKNTTKAKGKVWLCHKPELSVTDLTTGLAIANMHQGTVIHVAASAKGDPKRKDKLRAHLKHGDVAFDEVDPALATPEQSQAFVKGGPCIVETQLSTNTLGIQVITRRVTFPTTPPLTTITVPVSSSSEGSAPEQ
jgi:hypothetical protein